MIIDRQALKDAMWLDRLRLIILEDAAEMKSIAGDLWDAAYSDHNQTYRRVWLETGRIPEVDNT